jgi:predicted deacylase
MKQITHPLTTNSAGTRREIHSIHFGAAGTGPKAYIQASLHADELPGMLVAQHLRRHFAALEVAGKINGEIVLVPAANPIGLSQTLLGMSAGRFDVRNGQNFNRNFHYLVPRLIEILSGQLGLDPQRNVALIRDAIRQLLAFETPLDDAASQRLTLMRLAADADIVLDLHCDCESVAHMYVGTPLWNEAEPMARLLGAQAVLLATESGDDPFDEACSRIWWELREHFNTTAPVPLACLSATLELRGLGDVRHDLAAHDAQAIVSFLGLRGVIDGPVPTLPALQCEPTPLSGSIPLVAPSAGLVVFLREPGELVKIGEPLVEIIEPVSGEITSIGAPADGVFYARENRRYVSGGTRIGKVAGRNPLRTGTLLSA